MGSEMCIRDRVSNVTPSCGLNSRYVIREAALDKAKCFEESTASFKYEADDLHFEIIAYPNPVTELLQVSIDADSDLPSTVRVVDNFGKTVHVSNQVYSNLSIEVADYPDGLYHVIIQNGETQRSTRVIKS